MISDTDISPLQGVTIFVNGIPFGRPLDPSEAIATAIRLYDAWADIIICGRTADAQAAPHVRRLMSPDERFAIELRSPWGGRDVSLEEMMPPERTLMGRLECRAAAEYLADADLGPWPDDPPF